MNLCLSTDVKYKLTDKIKKGFLIIFFCVITLILSDYVRNEEVNNKSHVPCNNTLSSFAADRSSKLPVKLYSRNRTELLTPKYKDKNEVMYRCLSFQFSHASISKHIFRFSIKVEGLPSDHLRN